LGKPPKKKFDSVRREGGFYQKTENAANFSAGDSGCADANFGCTDAEMLKKIGNSA